VSTGVVEKKGLISIGASEFRNDKVPGRGVCGVGSSMLDVKLRARVT